MSKEYATNVEKAVKEFREKRVPLNKKIISLKAEIKQTEKDLKNELNNICGKHNVSSSLVSRILK